MAKGGLGAEDKLHKIFASHIRHYEALGKLKCAFWSYDASGERRTPITGALLKAKGLAKGKPDYEFIIERLGVLHHIYIEFKIKPNKQSKEQKDFEAFCKNAYNTEYNLCYSLDEAIEVLKKRKIIVL